MFPIIKPEEVNFLANGGKMGQLICSIDWSKSSLGSIDSWPQSLQTAVSIMLNSPYPMQIWWGEELTYFYNDAYTPILGDKHPAALGKSARTVWTEIWSDMAPRIDLVMQQKQATFDEALLMILKRHGYEEETYYTFSFSPILNEQGEVGGIFNACNEETQQIVGERQLALLRELAAKTANARTVDEACAISANYLKIDDRDLPFTLIYLLEPEGKHLRLAGSSGIHTDHPACPDTIALDSDTVWPIQDVMVTGQFRLMEPLSEIFDSLPPLPAGPWDCSLHQAIIMPVLQPNQRGKSALFIAGLNPYRPLNDDYRRFLELVTAQISSNITNAQAYEDERKRAEALAAIDRAKTVFFSNVSHEFRTPLTLMLGPVQDILKETHSLSSTQQEQLNVVYRNALRLQKLVNSLLDFSRIEAGRIQASYQSTDLAMLTKELASMFRSTMEQAGLTLIVDCAYHQQPVYVDRDMWEKVILNLLSNAYKHTFEGQIEVTLHEEEDRIVVQVRDTGVGIASEEIPHLFERFHRVSNSRSRTHEGSGIGLALVNELIHLHGGLIQVESTVGQGSQFTISIPTGVEHLPIDQIVTPSNLHSTTLDTAYFVEEASRWLPRIESLKSTRTIQPPQDIWHRPDGQKVRILLVDDNLDMREYISRLLEVHCDVENVPDGEAALAAARRQPPDLVLSDIMMPNMDGFQLLSILRQDVTLKTIPVVLLSARAGEEARIEGLQAGADDYITKPFNASELLARVKANLNLTLQQALSGSEKCKSVILEMSLDAIITMDTTYTIMEWNSAAEKIFGYSCTEILGQNLIERMIPERYQDKYLHNVQHKLLNGESSVQRIELPVLRKDGHEFPAEFSIMSIVIDGHTLLTTTWRDITERKQAEQALKESNENLERMVAERTHQLEIVNKELETFSYSVSHDLRAPLRAIDGFSQALFEDYEEILDADGKRYLHWIREGSQKMAQLIDGMLNLSRLTRGELKQEMVDMSQLVADIARDLQFQQPDRIVEFVIQNNLKTHADKRLIQAVLQNLIENAWKYTSHHSQARIEFGSETKNGEFVYFVKDDGAGFDMRYAHKLFGLFQRLHNSDEFQGNGIGLATVERIIHRHGGRIWVDSIVEKGTTFYFTFEGRKENGIQ